MQRAQRLVSPLRGWWCGGSGAPAAPFTSTAAAASAAASAPPPAPFQPPPSEAADAAAPSSPSEPPPPRQRRPRVLIQTHGCQSNVADSEVAARVLHDAGYDAGPHVPLADADAVLVNTCAIREGAEAKIMSKLGVLREERRQRRQRQSQQQLVEGQQQQPQQQQQQQPPDGLVVGVLGCMAERLRGRLLDADRLADVVAGPDAYRALPQLLAAARAGAGGSPAAMNVALSIDETYADLLPLRRAAGGPSAFVSIQRGCNNLCSFCIVPHVRGRERSRPAASVLREVEAALREGAKEVTLLGQNVNSYLDTSACDDSGRVSAAAAVRVTVPGGGGGGGSATSDDGGGSSSSSSSSSKPGGARKAAPHYAPGFTSICRPPPGRGAPGAVDFAGLLAQVAALDPELRVRFTSPHPKDFGDDVLAAVAALPNVCSHLHMPAQSGADTTLERMRRGYTRGAYDALVARARARIPQVALSTDIIVGFCGETDADHAATLDLLRSTRYSAAFLFAYSRRDKTHAARHYGDDVPQGVKDARLQEAFAAFREGQRAAFAGEPGRVHLVLTEGPARRGAGLLAGRTCTNKRAVFGGGPLPAGLGALRAHAEAAAAAAAALQRRHDDDDDDDGYATSSISSGGGIIGAAATGPPSPPSPLLYAGPTVEPRPGDYVAVRVDAVAGNATLVATPLAVTTLAEFVATFGATVADGDGDRRWAAGIAAAAEATREQQQQHQRQQLVGEDDDDGSTGSGATRVSHAATSAFG